MKVSIKTKLKNRKDFSEMDSKIAGGVNKAAAHVQEIAKRKAVEDTGNLRNSIKTEPAKRIGRKITARVFTNLHYAPYVEFGTGRKGEATNQNSNIKVTYKSDWSGAEAQPFLFPASREGRKGAKEMIAESVKGL